MGEVRLQVQGFGSLRSTAVCSWAQLGAWVGAQLVGEQLFAKPFEPVERVGAAPRGVQCPHVERFERFRERVFVRQVGHRGDHRAGPAEPQLQVAPAHRRVEPSPVPGRADLVGPVTVDPGQRHAPPAEQRLVQRRGPVGVGAARVVSAFDQ